MTKSEAEKFTGLTARLVSPPINGAEMIDPHMVAIGDHHRYQLGRHVSHIAKVPEMIDGRIKYHTVATTVFHLIAFGSSFEDAVAMYRRNKAASEVTDESARKALQALAA